MIGNYYENPICNEMVEFVKHLIITIIKKESRLVMVNGWQS